MLDDVQPVDPRHARRRRDEIQKQVDGRRLPCAVRSEQAEDLTGLDGQVEVIDGEGRAEGFRQFGRLNHNWYPR
jgi:hypothetical protein